MMRKVEWNGRVLEYELTYKAVKNLNLRVRQDGSVAVSAPRLAKAEEIDGFVRGNAERVFAAREKIAAARQAREQTLAGVQTGEKIAVWGVERRIVVVEDGMSGGTLEEDRVVLHVSRGAGQQERIDALNRVLSEQCRKVFAQAMDRARARMRGIELPPRVALKIRTMKTRWGVCAVDKAQVTLNSRLVFAPLECVEYVCVHELCHFVQANHSPAFYAVMERALPEWKALRTRLNAVPSAVKMED